MPRASTNRSSETSAFSRSSRGPDDDLKLHFEAVKQFSPEEKRIAKAVIEGLILKHDASRFAQGAKT